MSGGVGAACARDALERRVAQRAKGGHERRLGAVKLLVHRRVGLSARGGLGRTRKVHVAEREQGVRGALVRAAPPRPEDLPFQELPARSNRAAVATPPAQTRAPVCA